jgi:hypothetical protein
MRRIKPQFGIDHGVPPLESDTMLGDEALKDALGEFRASQ